jgi:hypothetical protein
MTVRSFTVAHRACVFQTMIFRSYERALRPSCKRRALSNRKGQDVWQGDAITSDQPGLYRFLVETGMAGKWELIIFAVTAGVDFLWRYSVRDGFYQPPGVLSGACARTPLR